MDALRAEIARVSQQIEDLETAYFAGTGGVEDAVVPLGPLKVVNKKQRLPVRREQRVFSLSAGADGAPWPARAHAPHELAAALAAGGVTPGHVAPPLDSADDGAGGGAGGGAPGAPAAAGGAGSAGKRP
jgi:hypothetical protein